MRTRSARASGLAAAAALLFSTGCGIVRVAVPVMRPAEVNMAGYSTIAVGGMQGHHDRAMTTALEEGLVKSERFKVVDRQHLNSIMRELKISASDLADPENANKLGKQISANALIFGTVEEKYAEEKGEDSFKDNKGVTHVIHKLRGEIALSATFKVTDVSTGQLVVAKTYDERREDTNTGIDEAPRPIDRDGLSKSARGSVLRQFLHAIVPHKDYIDAAFYTDGDLPQLETGIGYAQRGDWKKAQDVFNDAIGAAERNPKIKSKTLGKAYWNLGLSYEYAGDYAKATSMIDKAYQLSQDADMLAELDNIKRHEAEAKKLAEQTGKGEVIRESK